MAMRLGLRSKSTRGKPRATKGGGKPPLSQMGWWARMTGCEWEWLYRWRRYPHATADE